MTIKITNFQGFWWVLNFNHVLYITPRQSDGYLIAFVNGDQKVISEKEFQQISARL